MLAEQEAVLLGADTSGITYGGDQRATDGGVDVRATLPTSIAAQGYLPRLEAGFQVKAEAFGPAKITKEMRPKGVLRDSIVALGRAAGAYIIVSSRDSASDSMLSKRRNAMAAAIADEPEASSLHLDFYDQNRLARWVNQHPGLVPWVREKIGEPLSGWRPFADWSSSPEEETSEYVIDDQVRLVGVQLKDTDGLDVASGINRIRDILRKPGGVVRIVGLSGVGKTRLVQALFDSRVGTDALEKGNAVYTDLSDSPDPIPLELLGRLSNLNQQCVLVIDNCGVELHRKLAVRLKQSAAPISVITVEYDISDDEPEHTDVFKLEPSSSEVLERILERRYPVLSNPEIGTIARFSEGNARVAIALAETSGSESSLANLSDSDLFRRLFVQKKAESNDLLTAAKAMSLVYSFDGTTTNGDTAELPLLAGLAGQSIDEFYGHVAELKRRKLVQSRGRWRALLPHALAHKLAKEFLEDRPPLQLADAISQSDNERLVKSFTRRLGFLHDSAEAASIVEQWLAKGGWLSEVERLNAFGLTLLDNIAPVSPERVLETFEEAARRVGSLESLEDPTKRAIARLLRLLAYAPDLFERASRLLTEIASVEKSNNVNDAHNEFVSLFSLYLSGTHATADQRSNLLLELARQGGDKGEALVLGALRAMLNTGHFMSFGSFEFGTRKRDYGWHPRTGKEINDWYLRALNLLQTLLDENLLAGEELKALLADRFENLAGSTGLIDELVALARHIHEAEGWPEGWGSVRATARSAEKEGQSDVSAKLHGLANEIEPKDLAHRIDAYAIPERWSTLDLADIDDDDDNKYEKANARIEAICVEIGSELCANIELLRLHLPRLIQSKSSRMFCVGKGVGTTHASPAEAWREIVAALKAVPASDPRNVNIGAGFLSGLQRHAPAACEDLLDEVLRDEALHPFFLPLQCSVDVSDRGWTRLIAGLEHTSIPTHGYQNLAYQPASNAVDETRLSQLIECLLERPDGFQTGLQILHMRFHRLSNEEVPISEGEKQVARKLLTAVNFGDARQQDDYALQQVAETALQPDRDHELATRICMRLLAALSDGELYGWDCGRLVDYLAQSFPRAVLDILVEQASSSGIPYRLQRVFENLREVKPCPISQMDTETVLRWAKEASETRFELLAAVTRPWQQGDDKQPKQWSPIALELLRAAPKPSKFLNSIMDRFRPTSWSGSRAEIMESRLPLLEALKEMGNGISEAATDVAASFRQEIAREREWEAKERREEDERFEW